MQKIKDFRKGKKLFLVHALGKGSFLSEVTLVRLSLNERITYKTLPDSYYNKAVIIKTTLDGFRTYETDFHLEDMNVVGFKNNYNNHRCFFTAQAAYRYLNKLKGECYEHKN